MGPASSQHVATNDDLVNLHRHCSLAELADRLCLRLRLDTFANPKRAVLVGYQVQGDILHPVVHREERQPIFPSTFGIPLKDGEGMLVIKLGPNVALAPPPWQEA